MAGILNIISTVVNIGANLAYTVNAIVYSVLPFLPHG